MTRVCLGCNHELPIDKACTNSHCHAYGKVATQYRVTSNTQGFVSRTPNMMTFGSCSICGQPTINGSCADTSCRSHFTKTLQPWGFPTPIAAIENPLVTRDVWKQQQWDSAIYKVGLLTKLEQQMVYFYLNKSGMTVSNLDHDIDRELNKQHDLKYPKVTR